MYFSFGHFTLIKIVFIIADAFWMMLAGTPPNSPRPSKEHIIPDWRERFLKSLAAPGQFLRTTYWTAGLIEILLLLARTAPTHPLSPTLIRTFVLNSDPGSIDRLRITPTFLLGNTLTCLGALLRLRCYRALGKLFSFELCIHHDHRLVAQGPYSVVRHPSYTGLIATILGAYFVQVSGSWVSECGLVFAGRGMGAAVVGLWIGLSVSVMVSLVLRIPAEDGLLKEKFGEEWIAWSKKVPYRLVPGVY